MEFVILMQINIKKSLNKVNNVEPEQLKEKKIDTIIKCVKLHIC